MIELISSLAAVPELPRYLHQSISQHEHQDEESPGVGCCCSYGLGAVPVEVQIGLEGDVGDEDDGDEEIGAVVDGIVPQARL